VVGCVGCRQADYDRTARGAGAVNHLVAGFPTSCKDCHGTWRFTPGVFAAHEACFAIRTGRHAGIRCVDCHTRGIPPLLAGQPLTCNPIPAGAAPADCMHCHGNPAGAHQGVPGYFPSNPRCYECHRFSGSASGLTGGAR